MKTIYGLATLCLITACGGDSELGPSGVAQETLIGEMTTSEIGRICEFAVAVQGGAGRVVNCGERMVMVETANSCVGGWDSSDLCPTIKVKQVEACLESRGDNICRDVEHIDECKVLFACDEEVPETDGGVTLTPNDDPLGDEWDCYLASSSNGYYGCEFEWRCPHDADRSLTCVLLTSGAYQCTCRDVKVGMDEGAFVSSDICSLESHNIAYRANQGCGYEFPER